MRFTPKSEKQIQEERFPVVKPGKYHFEVTDAKDEVSKKGNEMIVLRLKIFDQNLNPVCYVNDYLMENMAHKLRHAAYVCGLGNSYESGELHSNLFIGKTGTVDLVIQKDKTGQYADKNSVQDYFPSDSEQQKKPDEIHSIGGWGDDLPEPPAWVK